MPTYLSRVLSRESGTDARLTPRGPPLRFKHSIEGSEGQSSCPIDSKGLIAFCPIDSKGLIEGKKALDPMLLAA